jgi:hypothetical protein
LRAPKPVIFTTRSSHWPGSSCSPATSAVGSTGADTRVEDRIRTLEDGGLPDLPLHDVALK